MSSKDEFMTHLAGTMIEWHTWAWRPNKQRTIDIIVGAVVIIEYHKEEHVGHEYQHF